jgi:hypothetical protein
MHTYTMYTYTDIFVYECNTYICIRIYIHLCILYIQTYIGECGLDRAIIKDVSMELQCEILRKHIEIAAKYSRPVTIHCVGVYMLIYLCIDIYACVYVYVYAHTYAFISTSICTCACIYTYPCIHICIHMNRYIYLYIYNTFCRGLGSFIRCDQRT